MRSRNGRDVWVAHPDQHVDLGAFAIDADQLRTLNVRFTFFQGDDHAWTIAEMQAEGVAEGDGVFVLGYPMGLVGADWQTAVCRGGSIARIQDVLIAGVGDFLIDASIFPGNSGGPVIIRPESTSIVGTKSISKANLIGVVQGYLSYEDVAVSAQTNQPRILFNENSGLGPVIPVDRLNELVEAAMRRMRNRTAHARWKAKQQRDVPPTSAN
jgi:S1-C subfamily serine protease